MEHGAVPAPVANELEGLVDSVHGFTSLSSLGPPPPRPASPGCRRGWGSAWRTPGSGRRARRLPARPAPCSLGSTESREAPGRGAPHRRGWNPVPLLSPSSPLPCIAVPPRPGPAGSLLSSTDPSGERAHRRRSLTPRSSYQNAPRGPPVATALRAATGLPRAVACLQVGIAAIALTFSVRHALTKNCSQVAGILPAGLDLQGAHRPWPQGSLVPCGKGGWE